MVSSSSKDPIFSIATTVAKNIRDGAYNRPELVSVKTNDGRKIALPQWKLEPRTSKVAATPMRARPLTVTLPPDISQRLRLAVQAGLASTDEEMVIFLVKRGLAA